MGLQLIRSDALNWRNAWQMSAFLRRQTNKQHWEFATRHDTRSSSISNTESETCDTCHAWPMTTTSSRKTTHWVICKFICGKIIAFRLYIATNIFLGVSCNWNPSPSPLPPPRVSECASAFCWSLWWLISHARTGSVGWHCGMDGGENRSKMLFVCHSSILAF